MNLGRESESLEFKESTSEIDDALDDMSAMLNKNRRGTIYFGVDNNGEVIGMELGKKTEAKIAQKIDQCMEPTPFYSIRPSHEENGRGFIELSFSGEDVLYAHRGIYYIRNADKSTPMPTAVLRDYFLKQQTSYNEWESSPSGISLEQIDEALVRRTIDQGNRLGRIKHPYRDLADAMRFLHLLTKDDVPNRAGELLFGNNKPFSARLCTLSSFDKTDYVDMRRCYGNVFELIDASYAYVLSRLSATPVKKEIGVTRDTQMEISPKAIREILVNAFVHAHYGAGAEQEIAVFPNRVSIYNPGIFPPGCTPEQFAKKEIEPIDKNNRVSTILYFSDYVEHFGTGFSTALSEFAKDKTTYRYYSTQGGFAFEMYRKGAIELLQDANGYAQAMNIIRQDNYITKDMLAILLGVSMPTVSRILKNLQDNGKLTRVGANKNGRWVLL